MLSGLSFGPAPLRADMQRFAVIVGNNRGLSDDEPLRYAVSDAERIYGVLRELGGFQPHDMVLLRDEAPGTLRQTLSSMQERVRAAAQSGPSMLLFYYSGHADAAALHLRDGSFELSELEQQAHNSPANVRVLVLDACQSGALTRVKGGRVQQAFALPAEQKLAAGEVFLTASSSSEDAQESDELRGSFFTHAFVSALLGAADDDHDGAVELEEAYRYAYQATLRATSRTRAGAQHPTYHYDLRGASNVILTQPERHAAQRASLRFPDGMSFLILRDSAEGAIVAELSERSPTRSLSLAAGRYFVRGRGQDVLFEGSVYATEGGSTPVELERLSRIEYAKLVRKGRSERLVAHGLEAGVRGRSVLPGSDVPCGGGFLGYAVDFAQLGARVRLDLCKTGFENGQLSADVYAYDLDFRLYHVWDVSAFFVELGLGGGASVWSQRFVTRDVAPARDAVAPFVSVGAATGVDFTSGFYASLDAAGETHFLQVQPSTREPGALAIGFALRATLAVGRRF